MFGLNTSSVLGIGLRLTLYNNFSNNANAVINSMGGINNAARILKSNLAALRDISLGSLTAGLGILRGYSKAFKVGSEFKFNLAAAGAAAGATKEQVHEMGQVALDLSRKYNYGPVVFAKAMEDIAKAGVEAKNIPAVMSAIAQTAVAAREELTGEMGVAKLFIDMVSAWRIPPGQLTTFGDMVTKTALISTIGFKDIAESMKYSQDVLRDVKMPIHDALAMIAFLGNQGIKASVAGISAMNMYKEFVLAVSGASDKKTNALKALGLDPASFVTAKGDLEDIMTILQKFHFALKNVGSVERQRYLFDIFGVRGKRGASPLIDYLMGDTSTSGAITKSFNDIRDSILNSKGANQSIVDTLSQTTEYQWTLFTNALDRLAIAVHEALPLLIPIIKGLTYIIQGIVEFSRTSVGKFFITAGLVIGSLLTAFGVFGLITSSVGLFLIRGKVSAIAMGRAMVWAWNAAGAAAMRYLGLQQAINARQLSLIRLSDGRWAWRNTITGRFAKGPISASIAGAYPFIGWLARLSPTLAKLAYQAFRLTEAFTGIGMVMLFLEAVGVDFKTQLKVALGGIIWIIQSAINVIEGMLEWIPGVDFGGGGYSARQARINKIFDNLDNVSWRERNAPVSKTANFNDNRYESPDYKRFLKSKETSYNPVINLYIDGKLALSKALNDLQSKELVNLGLNNV
jgi:TP901 family phage tail tape measure protein